jgi:uncharacterized protein YebE (UPF0316 family)
MYWDVVELKSIAPRTLEVLFKDGLRGTIFIDVSFCTGVFEVLKDDEMVKLAFIENGVVTWENELDLAPDTMYKEIKNSPNRRYILSR